MTKTELVKEVAKKADLSVKNAGTVVDAVFDTISETLQKNEDVNLKGFGIFATSLRKGREGRSPKTGEALMIPDQMTARFKFSKHLLGLIKTNKIVDKKK